MKENRRFVQVARQLAADIASGTFPVGSTLPSEPTLAETLGVSRSTLRAALGELQKLGMVSRRPSLGTRIEAAQPQRAGEGYSQTLGSIEAIVQYAADTLRDDLSVTEIVLDQVLAPALGAEPGSRWLKISYRRISKSAPKSPPICWTDVYVVHKYADAVKARISDHKGAVSELVEEASGRPILQVDQALRACGVPAHISEALETATNSHALEITRRYFLGLNELVLASISIHPGDRFTYSVKMSRTA